MKWGFVIQSKLIVKTMIFKSLQQLWFKIPIFLKTLCNVNLIPTDGIQDLIGVSFL